MDTHLHTALSLDAGLFGNTLGPDQKVDIGVEFPKEAKLVHQERAYTTPIWCSSPKG